jgi:hypothetical protein
MIPYLDASVRIGVCTPIFPNQSYTEYNKGLKDKSSNTEGIRTFRGNLSAPSCPLKMGPIGCPYRIITIRYITAQKRPDLIVLHVHIYVVLHVHMYVVLHVHICVVRVHIQVHRTHIHIDGIRPHTKKVNDEASSGKVVNALSTKDNSLRMVMQ